MSLNNSRASYRDCFELLDRGLDAERGVRIEVADMASANYLRMRIHHARVIDRRENAATYVEKDHPLHNKSVYDELVVRLEQRDDDKAWVYLDKVKVAIGVIEEIPEDYQITYAPQVQVLPSSEPVKLIEGPKQGIRRR